MTWDVAVEALLDTKQAKEVRRDLVRCSTPFPLPEKGVDADKHIILQITFSPTRVVGVKELM